MNIPPKYEDVVAKLDAALSREAALQEELEAESKGADRAAECLIKWRRDCIALQQRLTVAERRTDDLEDLLRGALRHVPHYGKSDWKGSLRHQINEALKPAAKPHKCIECDSQYCHGVCVERGDDDERYKGAEGEWP